MIMKKTSFLAIILFIAINTITGQAININEMDVLIGNNWKGDLTYLDYSSNEEVSISVEMEVIKVKAGVYEIAYSYPNEPNANSKSKIKITDDGKIIAGNQITSTSKNKDGSLMVHAISHGKDNGKKATFYYTYMIGSNLFSAKKSVEYEHDERKFIRNVYQFSR